MSTKLFKRPTRRVPPEMPSGELTLQEPPVLPEEASGNVALLLTYIPMAMGSSLTMLLFTNSSSMSGTRMWLAGGPLGVDPGFLVERCLHRPIYEHCGRSCGWGSGRRAVRCQGRSTWNERWE